MKLNKTENMIAAPPCVNCFIRRICNSYESPAKVPI